MKRIFLAKLLESWHRLSSNYIDFKGPFDLFLTWERSSDNHETSVKILSIQEGEISYQYYDNRGLGSTISRWRPHGEGVEVVSISRKKYDAYRRQPRITIQVRDV